MINSNGKWFVNKGIAILTEPSPEYESKRESDEKNAKKMNILDELKALDIEVPRVLEDIILQFNVTVHQSKQDIILRKQELRLQLKIIENG